MGTALPVLGPTDDCQNNCSPSRPAEVSVLTTLGAIDLQRGAAVDARHTAMSHLSTTEGK